MSLSLNFDPDKVITKLKVYSAHQKVADLNSICASVLVPFIFEHDQWRLLFTQRTQEVNSHKGQISFPGGRCEKQDRTVLDTAIREAGEEIGLTPSNLRIFGELPKVSSIDGYYIYPIVGQILEPFEFGIEVNEVESVFSIPIDFLFDPDNWQEKDYQSASKPVHKVIFYRAYENRVIWGITARIIVDLAEILAK